MPLRTAPPATLSAFQPATPAPAIEPVAPHRPRLATVVRRVGLSLLIACVIPAALFYGVFAVAGVWTAIVVALAWSYGAIGWRALTGRRTSGLLLLTALLLTVRTGIAMLTDSTWLYFLQPVITDGVVSTLFLLSLVSARPMVARLAGDFYPMDHELALRPRIQRLFRNLTVLWALLGLAKATMTLWLLQSTSMSTFILVKSISALTINMVAAAATIALAAYVARQEGLLGHAPAAL
ncbi:septation protein IspZ [Nocardioides sp. KIGAM211]|uniref:Septation protein IspZ n=1 Tax=Nocardioides luti TaxID=2761101 RepID=A0A7X0RJ62_9ACTN|nr:VC0807 family protein [Nocardioides luti]MBB6628250.1 septation protein IspZ [Nocardioides luti]